MKKYLLFAFLFWSVVSVYSQVVISTGSHLVVNSGSVVVVNDIDNSGGVINNNGELKVLGNITNNTSGLFESTSTGTLSFEGSSAQEITGNYDVGFYGVVDINNSNGVNLTNTATGSNQSINGTLNFTSGKFLLNSFNLTLGSIDPTGTGTLTYIVTNSTGVVKRSVPADGSTVVTFPVGKSAYNPLLLQNSVASTTDTYSVKVVDSKPSNFSGTSHIVDRSWVITETVPGNSELTITTQWNSTEELTSFDRTVSTIGITTDDGTTVDWGSTSAATGSDPYTQTRSGVTDVGTLMVGDYYYGGISINLQAFLAAAYNSENGNMDKTLNTAGLIPTTDPYSLGTTVNSIPSNAVDWVKIELRDKNDITSILYSFARFINQSGQIIEEDGSNLNLTGVVKDSYYIAIVHRNHFGVISSSTVNLDSSPSLSFKTSQSNAWQDPTISSNAAMKEVEAGVFALWDGDANGDGEIKYNGTTNDKNEILSVVGLSTPNNIVSSYSDSDANMDGEVKYNGTSNDKNEILGVVGLSTPNAIKTEHLPN